MIAQIHQLHWVELTIVDLRTPVPEVSNMPIIKTTSACYISPFMYNKTVEILGNQEVGAKKIYKMQLENLILPFSKNFFLSSLD